jgi:hypothetical protein
VEKMGQSELALWEAGCLSNRLSTAWWEVTRIRFTCSPHVGVAAKKGCGGE